MKKSKSGLLNAKFAGFFNFFFPSIIAGVGFFINHT